MLVESAFPLTSFGFFINLPFLLENVIANLKIYSKHQKNKNKKVQLNESYLAFDLVDKKSVTSHILFLSSF